MQNMQLVAETNPPNVRFQDALAHRLLELFGGVAAAKVSHDKHIAMNKPTGSQWDRLVNQSLLDITRELECLPSEAHKIPVKIKFKGLENE